MLSFNGTAPVAPLWEVGKPASICVFTRKEHNMHLLEYSQNEQYTCMWKPVDYILRNNVIFRHYLYAYRSQNMSENIVISFKTVENFCFPKY